MEYAIGLMLLLGGLIFIHELGHFLFAKLYGVRVDTFSIGMGKKILSKTVGETEYALSIFPLGGYVKLLGQDPREEVPKELENRSFRSKPLYQRTAVVLAGPLFNAVLAVVIFIALYAFGVPSAAPTLTRVLPESPASQAGFQSGDLVKSISVMGKNLRVRELTELEKIVGENEGRELIFSVERRDQTQVLNPSQSLNSAPPTSHQIAYTPVRGQVRDSTTGIFKEQGIIDGVERNLPAPVVVVDKNSWFAQRQVPSAFWVKEINYSLRGIDQKVTLNSFNDLEKAWAEFHRHNGASDRGQFSITGFSVLNTDGTAKENEPEDQSLTLAWSRLNDAPPLSLTQAGLHSAELVISEIVPEKPAEKWGLKIGDRIETIDGKRIYSFPSFRERVQKNAGIGKSLRLTWTREGKVMSADLSPQMTSTTDPLTEVKKDQYQIGAAFHALQAAPDMTVLKAESMGDAIALGFSKTWGLTQSMVGSFYYLVSGQVSHKTLGGPILIGKIAGDSLREGLVPFFRMMAFISLNLFILNLMPIPVLDGGHLVLFAIEAITRRPVATKIIEIWTTAGFVFLMGIFAIVMFNDIARLGIFKIFS